MKRITITISAMSERHRRIAWCATAKTTPSASSGPTVLRRSLVKTVSARRATAASASAPEKMGPPFSSPRTSFIMTWRPLAPYTTPSGRSARSGGRSLLLCFGLEPADAWTQVLEHEREPDRGEQDRQEDDDRRRLLTSGGHGGRPGRGNDLCQDP